MRSTIPSRYNPVNNSADQLFTSTFTGPLILHADPVSPLHTATKNYIDTLFTGGLDATKIDSGIVSKNTLPLFSGDVLSSAGDSSFTLKDINVNGGIFTAVTVDSKGRIFSGKGLTADVIPPLPWNKITSGKPTTLSGYGITNGVKSAGDVIAGNLNVSAVPVSPLHAVNKAYLGTVSSSFNTNDQVGTVITKLTATTVSGYLRCNGAGLSKVAYAALYSVLGDKFTMKTANGSGKPWSNQRLSNGNTTTSITGWTLGTSVPGALSLSQAVVTKNRVYLLGGNNGSGGVATVYTAVIGGDGKLGAWSTGTNLPVATQESQAVVIKNRVYLIGGNFTSTVYTAPINSDGTLGTWTTSSSLPEVAYGGQAVVTDGYVHLFVGYTGSVYISKTYTAPINSDGTLGAWYLSSTVSNIPYGSSLVATKNRIYLLGGKSGGGPSAAVSVAPINADGTIGAWTVASPLPVVLYNAQTMTVADKVFLFGGEGYATVATVYTAPINEDGTLGAWTATTSLPFNRARSQLIVTAGRVHILCGHDGTNTVGNTYSAVFTGGSNDYSTNYDGSVVSSDPLNFYLPDLSATESTNIKHFIKH